MELTLDNGNAFYKIQSYQAGVVNVNGEAYTHPIIVTPQSLLTPWGHHSIETLEAEQMNQALTFNPQVVLLGTGKALQYPDFKIFASLMERNIGFEIMDTGAACRTYTLLMAEGRQVAACLLV